jgi:hypothetical protein
MLATAAKLALVVAAFALLATSADAQRDHRICAKSKDKVRCQCVMANGGQVYLVPPGRVRLIAPTAGSADRIARCLQRAGRQ